MNETERMQKFEEFVRVCDSMKYGEKQIIGQGNPKSNILIVGMEPAINSDVPNQVILDNIKNVQEGLKKKNEGLYCHTDHRRADFKGNHTWKIYQKLIDYIIFGGPRYEKLLDFEKYAFTTEMNNWVSKRKAINSGNRELFGEDLEQRRKCKEMFEKKLAQRRRLFEESAFIKDFPVVILACGDYIINHGDNRQIDDTFDVEFIKEYETKTQKGNSFKFWVHRNKKTDDKRLVIHTRQLSGAIPNEMLKSMADIIKEHL